jgi:hypothetical protein
MKEEGKLKLKIVEKDHIVVTNKVTGKQRVIDREQEHEL